jgi:bifunctional DNase/RNase
MRIADVVLPEGTNNGVVLLIDGASRYVLPVFIPASASESIRSGLKVASGAPDVLGRMVLALGGEVARIEVRQGADVPVAARIIIRNGGKELSIDALPAEALALAATGHAPVFAARAMLTNQGIRKEAVDHLPGGLPSHLHDPEQL